MSEVAAVIDSQPHWLLVFDWRLQKLLAKMAVRLTHSVFNTHTRTFVARLYSNGVSVTYERKR